MIKRDMINLEGGLWMHLRLSLTHAPQTQKLFLNDKINKFRNFEMTYNLWNSFASNKEKI